MTFKHGAAFLALVLAACGNGEKKPDGGQGGAERADGGGKLPTFIPPPELGGDERVETDFSYEWESLDRNDEGERDSFEIARWVTERSKEAGKAVSAKPPRVKQAIEILTEILDKVPDSSKDARLLGECYFFCAAWWFKSADTVAWEHLRLLEQRTLPRPEPSSPVVVLDQKAIDKLVKEYTAYSQKANQQVRVLAQKALDQFESYHRLRPDDKMIYDYVWKLYFYLQNYTESLRWLDALLVEMDAADFRGPARAQYISIRDSMRDELATMKLQGREVPTRTSSLIGTLTGGAPGDEQGMNEALKDGKPGTYR